MAKHKTAWFCQQCGAESSKWVGKCPACGQWNSMVEEPVVKESKKAFGLSKGEKAKPQKLSEISTENTPRIDLRSVELNRVLGGGLVPGSLVLLGGEPGIGKSTLVLQLSLRLKGRKILYVSGEESAQQIKLRADRIGAKNDECLLLSETQLENILVHAGNIMPEFVVIDSIQTLSTSRVESSPGSVTQVRECTAEILRFAKQRNVSFIIIGHITKEGSLAGPKVLEHIVDTVLQFEGDSNHYYRIIRSMKNRFGSTSEMGIFEMQHTGLREVTNPSELLINQHKEAVSGTAVAATIEGNRPLLIEVQALVSTAVYGTPQRSAIGFDRSRLNMLLAVLEKRAGFRLSQKDVFLNLAGGVKVSDPAIDLAVLFAILSSDLDISISKVSCFAGEVGLTGEIRPVSRIDQRIAEAGKMGFEKIYVSENKQKSIEQAKSNIEIFKAGKIEEVFRDLFNTSLRT
ncbi:MAG: DNA repair protein RadA [Bacteroidota bacterium]|nr:DNA repair protein RadA [Bacteroidota bacterium]